MTVGCGAWQSHQPLQWFFPKNARLKTILGIFSTGTYAGIGTMSVSSMKMLWKEQKKNFVDIMLKKLMIRILDTHENQINAI